ncbi:MAG: hypothetical protein V3U75_10440 [Methylococcaceae bacterium]
MNTKILLAIVILTILYVGNREESHEQNIGGQDSIFESDISSREDLDKPKYPQPMPRSRMKANATFTARISDSITKLSEEGAHVSNIVIIRGIRAMDREYGSRGSESW